MRSCETLALVVDLLVFLILTVPLARTVRWLHRAAPIALLATGAQVVLEGPRWQMVPAYVLAGLLFLVWLFQTLGTLGPAGPRTPLRRWTIRIAIGLGVLALAVSFAVPLLVPVFRFPHPTGPYEIGTLTYHWVDVVRPEVFTSNPDDRRELMVQIWYPVKGDGCGSIATALDGSNLDHLTNLSVGRSRGSGLGTSPSA